MTILSRIKLAIIVFLARFVVPCDVVTHRLSDKYQRSLSIRERLSNLFHMSICIWCRRYKHQLSIVQSVAHSISTDPDRTAAADGSLSDEARDRIRRALDQPGSPSEDN